MSELHYLDQIECFGDPWHGLYRFGRTELPNSTNRVPAAHPSGGDCFEVRVPGTLPATNSAEDIAAGRTWLDYGLVAGENHTFYGAALGAMSWVVIAEDGTSMRATVAISHVSTTEVAIRPLQGSTPVQTLTGIALTPAVSGLSVLPPYEPVADLLTVHKIMDVSPDGRTVILAHEYGTANGYPTAISQLVLSGTPGAMSATRTLIFYPGGPPEVTGFEETSDMVTMVTYHERLRNSDTNHEYERFHGPMSEAAWAGGGYAPRPPGYHTMWIQLVEQRRSGDQYRKFVIGYLFDEGTLRAVKFVNNRTDTGVGFVEPYNQPRVFVGRFEEKQYLEIGATQSAHVTMWTNYDSATSGGNPAYYRRYTNRVYGVQEQLPLFVRYHPPCSPRSQASGPTFDNVPPKAAYHPVTHQILYHEGGLGTVAFV